MNMNLWFYITYMVQLLRPSLEDFDAAIRAAPHDPLVRNLEAGVLLVPLRWYRIAAIAHIWFASLPPNPVQTLH